MAEQKVIAVVGATGAQGGGLVRAITADPGGAMIRIGRYAPEFFGIPMSVR